ncbi:MAG: 30S ribosomal protein S7 [Anaerolineales bacterium]|nr:30S ribosomal protein S7 [Anaerolineales bacterium]
MRRNRAEQREISPDVRYDSVLVESFIHRVMQRGKWSVAAGLVYDAFDMIEERMDQDPLEVFEQAVRNTSPMLEVKPRRVGGATYQVPVEVTSERRTSLAQRWLLEAARSRYGKSTAEKLAGEIMDAANGQGNAVRRKEEVHRMAEANRAFAHYRW